MAPGTRIVSLGHYQPARVLTNADLESIVETSDEWIRSRVGIETRRIAGPDEPVDDMAAQAAEKALAASGLAAADIDLVLVATCTNLDRSPSMSARSSRRSATRSRSSAVLSRRCAAVSRSSATASRRSATFPRSSATLSRASATLSRASAAESRR